jgi:hypothetical protein
MVNKVDASLNAALTANIDFQGIEFQGIATAAAPYSGTFDGQRHIVSNLLIDMPQDPNVGFFREITAGAHIMNLTIDASCAITGKNFTGAFIGHVSGNGNALLEQLGNEAYVSTIDQNAGGIVGCNTSGELRLTLINCYNAGNISSGWEAGGLSGWLGNDAVTTNCYNMGVVTNGESFARGNNIQLNNCYDPVTNWVGMNTLPIKDFTNGTLLAKLQEAAPCVWYRNAVNGHPVLYHTEMSNTIFEQTSTDASTDASHLNNIYNLNGQKITKKQKGINIINGRKVVIK